MTTADNKEVVSTLNKLIKTCSDGENGFRTAAEATKNPEYKKLFDSCWQQRLKFAGELQAEVLRLGGKPEESGSAAGALHRGWINLKTAITSGDNAIISECERGEDSAVKTYQECLHEPLPDHVRTIVERQYREVKQAHDRIREIERHLEAA